MQLDLVVIVDVIDLLDGIILALELLHIFNVQVIGFHICYTDQLPRKKKKQKTSHKLDSDNELVFFLVFPQGKLCDYSTEF